MKDLKYIIGFAAFGFLLSFGIATANRALIGVALGRGLISGVVFGAIAFGASFVFKRFLDFDGSNGATMEDTGAGLPKAAKKSDHEIDIDIENEDLPSQADEPGFVVGRNHQMLTPPDVAKTNPYSATKAPPPKTKKSATQQSELPSLDALASSSQKNTSAGGGASANNTSNVPNNMSSGNKNMASNNSQSQATSAPKANPATPKESSPNNASANANKDSAKAGATKDKDDKEEPPPFQSFQLGSGANGTGGMKDKSGDVLDKLPNIDDPVFIPSNFEVPPQKGRADPSELYKGESILDGAATLSDVANGGGDAPAMQASSAKKDASAQQGGATKESPSAGGGAAANSKKGASSASPASKTEPASKPATAPKKATAPGGDDSSDDGDIDYSGTEEDDDLEDVDDEDTEQEEQEEAPKSYVPDVPGYSGNGGHVDAKVFAEGKNIETMAKAISTLLTKDKE